jgi:hypothetical protein
MPPAALKSDNKCHFPRIGRLLTSSLGSYPPITGGENGVQGWGTPSESTHHPHLVRRVIIRLLTGLGPTILDP